MGLGSFLKKAVGVVAPVLSVLPTPLAPIARAVTALNVGRGATASQGALMPMSSPVPDILSRIGGLMPAGLMSGPIVGPGGTTEVANPVIGAIRGAGPIISRWLIGARGIARSATGKIVGVMKGTGLMPNKRVLRIAKIIGIEATAVALGITAADVAEMVVTEAAKPARRARGISGRDVRITRRTIGKIRSIEKGLRDSGICRRR